MSSIEETTSLWADLAERVLAGAGSVTCEHGKTYSGRLRLWQLPNGCLAIELITNRQLRCRSYHRFQGNLLQDDSVVDDRHIEVADIQLNHSVPLAPDFRTWRHLGTADRYATTYDIRKTRPECTKIVCGLTNLYLDHSVELELDSLHIGLGKTTGADQTYVRARALGGPAVLSELWATSDVPLPDDQWDEFVDRLRFVLSLAHRNYVGKAFKLRYGDEDHPCSQVFYGLGVESTRAARRPLIATDDLSEYLRQTFPRVPEVYNPWKLGVATDHYFRAMDSASAWPMGIGIVIALECLVSAFAGREGCEYHFSNEMEEFDPLLRQLGELALSFLDSHFPERVKLLRANRSERQSWETGLRSLNRRSFKRKMRTMLEALDVEVPKSGVLQRFVDIRNDLVHHGYPVSQDWSREFRKIMQMAEFLDTVLLAVLKYDGPVQKLGFSPSES
jgi:hypothetical protein